MITVTPVQQFQIFCLEHYKVKKKIPGHNALKEFKKNNVFHFLKIGYDVLHTQGKGYIMEEINDLINKNK